MTSFNPAAVNRPVKPRSKRFVQPVVPALPQITTARKNDERAAHHVEHGANESIQEASREESEWPSTTASLELSNGVHKDEISQTLGEDAVADIGASLDAPSPVSPPGRSSPMRCVPCASLKPWKMTDNLSPVSTSSHPHSKPQIAPSLF